MLVSIIIPVYNSEKYVERCVKSLFEQKYQDIEFIFVDDGSTDNSMNILNRLLDEYPAVKERVVILSHAENKGCAMARLEGMKHATGEYLIQVDSDDYVTPDYIEKLVTSAQKYGSDVVVCDYFYFHDNRIDRKVLNPSADPHEFLIQVLTGTIHNGLWNKLVRHNIFKDHDIYPVPGINMYDDKSVIFRVMYYAKKISYVGRPLYYYNKSNPYSVSAQNKITEIVPAVRFSKLADEFFAVHTADEQVHEALNLFKVSATGLLLLYGSREDKKRYLPELRRPTLRQVLKHPTIPFYYKIAVLFYVLHIPFVTSAARYLMPLFRKHS